MNRKPSNLRNTQGIMRVQSSDISRAIAWQTLCSKKQENVTDHRTLTLTEFVRRDVRFGVKTESQSAAPTNTDRRSEQSAKVLRSLPSCGGDDTNELVRHRRSRSQTVRLLVPNGTSFLRCVLVDHSPADTGGLTDGLWHSR